MSGPNNYYSAEFEAWFDEHYGPDTGSFKYALWLLWCRGLLRSHATPEKQP